MMAFFGNTSGSGDPLKKVHLFEHDAKKMADLVSLHPGKETGGNFFGLWADNDEPVLHIVLGPAIGCTRTEVSFYLLSGACWRTCHTRLSAVPHRRVALSPSPTTI